jgi:hypothetical protein
MSCYYPLFGLPAGLEASLTFSSHTLNQCAKPGQSAPHQHQLDLALYGSSSAGHWILYDRLQVPHSADVEVRASTYGLSPGELLVAVPLASDSPTDARPEQLPKPASKRLDRSPVAERCSLAFHWRGITSSYQGEYPLRMAEVKGGSFLSFDPLLKPDPAVGRSLVVLVSISRIQDPSPLTLELFALTSRELLQTVNHARNRCTIVDLTEEPFHSGSLVMRGKGWVGIPIVIRLSREEAPPSMSVEHTHPPTELFWEEDRLPGSRIVKSSWMGIQLNTAPT